MKRVSLLYQRLIGRAYQYSICYLISDTSDLLKQDVYDSEFFETKSRNFSNYYMIFKFDTFRCWLHYDSTRQRQRRLSRLIVATQDGGKRRPSVRSIWRTRRLRAFPTNTRSLRTSKSLINCSFLFTLINIFLPRYTNPRNAQNRQQSTGTRPAYRIPSWSKQTTTSPHRHPNTCRWPTRSLWRAGIPPPTPARAG